MGRILLKPDRVVLLSKTDVFLSECLPWVPNFVLISKRPDELKSCGPLYLMPLKKKVWFSRIKVGVNKIRDEMDDVP